MTIDDPKAYTKAWTARRIFRLRPPASELGEAVCEDMFIQVGWPIVHPGLCSAEIQCAVNLAAICIDLDTSVINVDKVVARVYKPSLGISDTSCI
jgi:hypothetical protein